MASRKTGPGDREIAAELRALRAQAHLTQEQAAERLGISYQQYGKYERAQDRISASMFRLAQNVLRPRIVESGGFSEAQSDFISGPGRWNSNGFQVLKAEWEQLKKAVDRFLSSLPDAKRSRR